MGGCHSNEPVADNSRPRAALVALVRNRELLGMRMAVRQIEDRFNRNYNYPYIFVNDQEFTEEFKEGIRALTNAEVSFGTLDSESWQVPEWINQTLYEEEKRTATYLHGEKDSYRKMCRFQSGYLHKHPLVADLDYYWRIEPDVEYYCDIDYDPFVYMRENGYKYGWTIAMPEFMPTVRTLWNTTMEFVNANQGLVAQNNMAEWLANGDAYNGCHFWSNFEIVDLSFYRSSTYQMFFDHLDRAGGFFYERWGDAPVHSIAAALFLNASQIHYFNDIGYYHPKMLYCPQGSSTKGRCVCDEDKAFIHNTACTVRYKEVRQKIVEPEAKEPAHTGPLVDFTLSVVSKS
ncbi:KTR mannosyltransferase [Coemansia spiralis]|nr:KTR mannosyltransferase [Coemansia spiralis]